jgi:hypothetical protein
MARIVRLAGIEMMHRMRPRRGLDLKVTITSAIFAASAACTALIDRSATQCEVDADCARFGTHPYCQAGVCVSSGLSPADCFYGTPQQPSDFLNQCSTAQCLSFDNCTALAMCGDAGDTAAALVPPPPAEAGAAPAVEDGDGGDAGPALPSCIDPNNGRASVVVLTGSSNFPPLLAKLAPLILSAQYTPVYQVTNSCTGVASVLGSDPSTHVITDPAPNSTGKYATYFQADGTAVPCTLGPDGASVDVGESDIFSSTCSGYGAPPAGVQEYLGPIQAMAFVVPGASQQHAISADAARAVFGMGAAGATVPWSNPALYFVRNQGTGTQQMIGKAIGVPAGQFWGIDRGSAASVDSDLRIISDPTIANQAIGIISTDYYDSDRANLNALAFMADQQDCAYLPDSTPFQKDKQNVRDGHYPIWGPLHFFAAVSNGIPTSPGAAAFVSVVSVPNLAQELITAFIASSLVPSCAMQVQRSAELGPLSIYTPTFECGCYFEATVSGAPSAACLSCTGASDCADPARPACNLGYCEAQ